MESAYRTTELALMPERASPRESNLSFLHMPPSETNAYSQERQSGKRECITGAENWTLSILCGARG